MHLLRSSREPLHIKHATPNCPLWRDYVAALPPRPTPNPASWSISSSLGCSQSPKSMDTDVENRSWLFSTMVMANTNLVHTGVRTSSSLWILKDYSNNANVSSACTANHSVGAYCSLGMRVDIVSAMSSISAFLTGLKRIQTPHSLFWGFGADKTFKIRWSGGRVQVWVQVRAPVGHLAITPGGCSRRQSKV